MMSLASVLVIASCLSVTHAAYCEWPGNRENNNFIDSALNKLQHTCPGLTDASEKQYCCTDAHGEFHCCDVYEFALTYIIIAVAIVAILSVICCVISCCCCPCCFIYKRRHGNIV